MQIGKHIDLLIIVELPVSLKFGFKIRWCLEQMKIEFHILLQVIICRAVSFQGEREVSRNISPQVNLSVLSLSGQGVILFSTEGTCLEN